MTRHYQCKYDLVANETYSYDTLGNLTRKGAETYTYPASGPNSVRPHAVTNNGVWQYTYDANGNLVRGGNRSYTWNADNQPIRITGRAGVTESYTYDADGQRLSRTRSGVQTVYLGGLWDEDVGVATTNRAYYLLQGQVVAQRNGTPSGHAPLYLHNDHLGSVVLTTNTAGSMQQWQVFTPWGEVRAGNVLETKRNFTDQHKDGTGLLIHTTRGQLCPLRA